MIGVVIAAHSGLAEALLNTAHMVVPSRVPVAAIGIDLTDDAASYEPKLEASIQEVNQGDGVLVLTDMFGGTPSNVGMTKHKEGEVEVLTGVNLPMILKALQMSERGATLLEIAREVKKAGERSITIATEVLSGQPLPAAPDGEAP